MSTDGRSTQGLRLFGAALVAGLGVAVLLAAASGTGSAAEQLPKRYYLALGDSIAYGFQPTKANAARASAFRGYVEVFAARLQKLSPQIEIVNYSCPGESTVTFARGRCPTLPGAKLHDTYRGPQLKAAVAFLRAHSGQVSPITLTLWGAELAPLSAKGNRARAAIASFSSRFAAILRQLRAAAPNADIIVTGAWNPEANGLRQTTPLYRSVDAAIKRAATASRARVTNMFVAFNGSGNVRAQKARLCRLTFACKDDPHPNDAGYRAMADAFLAASGYPRK
jgi:lysophospholipase L1-like esterase